MSNVGQLERAAQDRVVALFTDPEKLGYRYLGNWTHRASNRNVEAALLGEWLTKQGHGEALITKALHELNKAAALGETRKLYHANKDVYRLLRYGVKVKAGHGETTQTVWLIDWKRPLNNDFAIAEEVTIAGELKKRPDLVLYVNGIAPGPMSHFATRSKASAGRAVGPIPGENSSRPSTKLPKRSNVFWVSFKFSTR